MRVKIIVAAHKPYWMPEDDMYLPLHVGKAGKRDIGFQGDDTGNHISERNPQYCELTGLYWAWKNLDEDYIGLVHYRRHFSGGGWGKDPFSRVLTQDQLNPLLGRYRVLVPKRRRYYIETLYSHYAHTFYGEHLDLTREIIAEQFPAYLPAFDRALRQTSGYMFNMMILQQNLLDSYCGWLFPILFELEKRTDTTELSAFHRRFCARVGEIMFNVWLAYQLKCGNLKRREMKELPYLCMEKVDWLEKGSAFLRAKFFHQRYERSF